MHATITSEAVPPYVREQTLTLWARNRLQCGWFMSADFVPHSRDDFRRCLDLLAKHGDRATYVLSRSLMKCL